MGGVVHYCGNKTWLFLDIHHIICDGLSFGIFWNDVISVLHSEKPSAETVTAYDYALWENDILSGEKIQSDEAFFAAMIRGSQAVSFPNSETPNGAGKSCGLVEITMPCEEVDAYSKSCGVTPGSFWQLSFVLALKRLTREDRPLYLTVSNGRSDTQLANTVGMFVKTLSSCYAAENDASETCKSYVQETYKQLQEIYAREIVPYTLLVEKYGLNAKIIFAYQGGLPDEVDGAKAFPLTLDAVKFPLMMTVFQEESSYFLRNFLSHGRNFCMMSHWSMTMRLKTYPEASGESLPSPDAHDLLVILFTSETTGQPKAVELEHYGVVNYCHWYAQEFGLTMKTI